MPSRACRSVPPPGNGQGPDPHGRLLGGPISGRRGPKKSARCVPQPRGASGRSTAKLPRGLLRKGRTKVTEAAESCRRSPKPLCSYLSPPRANSHPTSASMSFRQIFQCRQRRPFLSGFRKLLQALLQAFPVKVFGIPSSKGGAQTVRRVLSKPLALIGGSKARNRVH